ncbi:MAG: pyrroloquinoline quinone precursor peptide PqqA [Azonexus sp.]|nr:pyrroloquinoline quinone precursor peptide PqqA [Azonexus sp.]MBP6906025.1 pyrroloquinoline quinone precursor peptide PqqA [Azonexus sp.]
MAAAKRKIMNFARRECRNSPAPAQGAGEGAPGAPAHHGCGVVACAALPRLQPLHIKEYDMQWIDPAFCDIRLGFEVTAYVYVR